MHKGVATVSISGDLAEKLRAIAAAKFDGVEIFDGDLVASTLRPEEIARRCDDLGLTVDLFQPVRDVEGLSPQQFAAAVPRMRRKLEVATRLGTSHVLVCSNVRTDAVEGPSAEQLGTLADLAAEHGVTLAFEALAWGTRISRVGQAWEVVRDVDHPNLTLAVDTFHMLARGDDGAALSGVPGERIGFLQVADAPVLAMDVLQWSRHHRCFPGQGSLDVAALVAAVIDAGYRGPVSLEIFSDVVRQADPGVTALDAMRSLLHLEEELRRGWDRPGERARPRVELFDPPPVPAPVDPAFVEIAATGDEMDTTLRGLGFTVAGRHRTTPVTWWRNGGADVLVNTGSLPLRHGHEVPRPSVYGLGVGVGDVPELRARRDAMLWPSLPVNHGHGEATLVGVESPSALHVFGAGGPGGPQDWRSDFEPGPEEQPAASPWLGLDHVGYAVPFGLSEAEVSFHRTLLGLLPGAVSEFNDPHGRMRSRVLQGDGSLRVVLNVVQTEQHAAATVGLNQVAFASDDVVVQARTMRAAGVDLLPVPDNYYDDLAARFDLPAGRLAELRDAGVMYDRDEDGGELLHVYTVAVQGRFYVELVQRNSGYAGFGAADTPIRLAAQSRVTEAAGGGSSRRPV